MEVKLYQEFASIYHNPLLLIFLYLSKAYNTMDRVRLVQTLVHYGVGPCICGFLATLWTDKKVVPKRMTTMGQPYRLD